MRFKHAVWSNVATMVSYILQFLNYRKYLIIKNTVKQNQMNPIIVFQTQALYHLWRQSKNVYFQVQRKWTERL